MKRKQRNFYKWLLDKEQREIWNFELSANIIQHLTLAFATQRLKLLQEKDAKWTAKDAVAGGIAEKDVAEELKKLKFDIAREKNIVADAKTRIEEIVEMIRVSSGRMQFIQSIISGQYQ